MKSLPCARDFLTCLVKECTSNSNIGTLLEIRTWPLAKGFFKFWVHRDLRAFKAASSKAKCKEGTSSNVAMRQNHYHEDGRCRSIEPE